MTVFHDVELEIVRPGPSHNQLLSPLTIYTALCGESAPVNFSVELEQHQLLDKISRLSYVIYEGREAKVIAEKTRQSAVADIGQEIGKILAKLQNLLFEQGRALGQAIYDRDVKDTEEHMVHLRLVSSASELANLPFELAISPAATPAEGKRMVLDLNLPIVLTREIRRTRPVPIAWDRKLDIKVLVIAAEPGFLTVPLKNHVRAIRKSLEPWIGWPKAGDEDVSRLPEVKKRMRILKNASIKSIYEVCSRENFTHIHILAHGGVHESMGEKRFGLVLCDANDPTKSHHVSGRELARALQAEHVDGKKRSAPIMVTLATCDSGAQGSVIIPGGSLAYDLHIAGIPWVLASQFPLSKKGSTLMTRELYPRIWRGDDPRKALFEVRRILSSYIDDMHDWASLVIYASLPPNFNAQVTQFFEAQTKDKIETAMGRADELTKAIPGGETHPENISGGRADEVELALKKVEGYLYLWQTRIPAGKDMGSRLSRAEYFGISGSVYKRIALLYKSSLSTEEQRSKENKSYVSNLKKAINSYDQAIDQWAIDDSKYHWVATQYLSLKAVLYWALSEEDKKDKKATKGRAQYQPNEQDQARFDMAKELALKDSLHAETDVGRAWGCGTLAELEMLSKHYKKMDRRRTDTVAGKVRDHCRNLIEHVGPDDFAVKSTSRQFMRYKLHWSQTEDLKWLSEIAKEAVNTLVTDS